MRGSLLSLLPRPCAPYKDRRKGLQDTGRCGRDRMLCRLFFGRGGSRCVRRGEYPQALMVAAPWPARDRPGSAPIGRETIFAKPYNFCFRSFGDLSPANSPCRDLWSRLQTFSFSRSPFLTSQADFLVGPEYLRATAKTPTAGDGALHIGIRRIYPHKYGSSPKGKGLSPHGFSPPVKTWLQAHNSTRTSTCQGRKPNFGKVYVLAQVQSDGIRQVSQTL